MTITSAGQVGIGTTSPDNLLAIGTNISAGTLTGISVGAAANRHVAIGQSTTNNVFLKWAYNATASSAYGAVSTYGGNNPLVLQEAGGNVGIGTNQPGARLHVKASSDNTRNSGIRLEHAGDTDRWNIHPENTSNVLVFSFNDQYSGSNYCYLSPSQAGLISVSDRRTKKDIQPITGSLARLMELSPTAFRYKAAEAGSPLNFGFIAQEVEEVYPDLVLEQNGLKTLASNSLIAINTQAIQELKKEKDAEVKALESENVELKAKLAAQEKRLAALEAKDKARDAKLAAIEAMLEDSAPPAARTVSLKKATTAK